MGTSEIVSLLSFGISVVSLGTASATMYFTWLKRGRLAMTKPTIVFFGHDAVPKLTPKIFLRTLLYSTSIKGKLVESMYAKLRCGDSAQIFSFWGYGETTQLTPGSGLYVGREGVALNHHFVLSEHLNYAFGPGHYEIEIFGSLAGQARPTLLSTLKLRLSEEQARALSGDKGVMFELDPSDQSYTGHIDSRPPRR